MKSYDHKKIEKKWQEKWRKDSLYSTPDKADNLAVKASANEKENFYLLVEFPYPSGNLHVGHWYAFAVPDILARAMRMQGKNVMYPIGFDAFGLPAENAAIKNKLNPRTWTQNNIAYMKKQIESMGTSFDWSREVITCDPAYYKWTQWLFLQLYKKGLVYRKETAVNWCPKDKTVLANEQVVAGRCERCDSEVEQRMMLQWNIKITDYADRLIDDLAPLNWPEQIKESQRNWIGRSEGAELDLFLDFGDPAINDRVGPDGKKAHITVFTTRPDTLFGATYLVLAPEHPWVTLALGHKTVLKNSKEVQKYVEQSKRKTELERQQETKDKTGVLLEGVYAINPASGEKIPMYVADYVLGHYGTGAIMAVPAHDERDFEFAKKFNLSIKHVVIPRFVDKKNPHVSGKEMTTRKTILGIVYDPKKKKYLCLEWREQPWVTFVSGGIEEGEDAIEAARREIMEETGYTDIKLTRVLGGSVQSEFFAAHKDVNRTINGTLVLFELISDARQPVAPEESERYEPIWLEESKVAKNQKIAHAEIDLVFERIHNNKDTYIGDGILINSGEFDGVSNEEAKRKIVEKVGGRFKNTYRLRDWIVSRQRYWGVPIPMIHCEKCGIVPVEDKDLPVVLPEVEDYLPDGDGKSPLAKVRSFVEVKCPQCGGTAERETDTLDTFVDSSWYFLRYSDPKNAKMFAAPENMSDWMPVDLYSGGAEHTTMHVLYSRFWQKALFDIGLVKDSEPYTRRMNRSLIMGPDGQKMSKSRGNVIDPDEVVANLGADTVRMYLAFIGPYNEVSSYPWNPDGVVGIRRFLERVDRVREFVRDDDVDALQNILHKTIKKVSDDIAALKFNTAISALMILLNEIEKEKAIGKEQYQTILKLLAPFAPHLAEELWNDPGNDSSIHLESWPHYDPALLKDEMLRIAVQINGKTRAQIEVAPDTQKEQVEEAARAAVAARLEGKSISRTIAVPDRLVNFVVQE